MSLPEPGRYIAGLLEWAVTEPAGKCPRFEILFQCRQVLDGGEWVGSLNEQITGYFTLVNRDGSLNDINIESLEKALGWDGQSFATLDGGNFADVEVQIVVEDRTSQDGKTFRNVKYINPRDYEGSGGVGQSDPQTIQSLDQKYGAVLRAKAKQNGKAPAPAAKPAAKPAAAAKAPQAGSKGAAWAAFKAKVAAFNAGAPIQPFSDEERAEVFGNVVREIAEGKDPNTLTAEEWSDVQLKIERDFDPALREVIPF